MIGINCLKWDSNLVLIIGESVATNILLVEIFEITKLLSII